MQLWSRNAQFNRPISTQIHIAIVTLGCPKTAQWETTFLNQRHRRPLYALAKALVDLGDICAMRDFVRPSVHRAATRLGRCGDEPIGPVRGLRSRRYSKEN